MWVCSRLPRVRSDVNGGNRCVRSNWENGLWFIDKCWMFVTHAPNPRRREMPTDFRLFDCDDGWTTLMTNRCAVLTRFIHKQFLDLSPSPSRNSFSFSRYTVWITSNYHDFRFRQSQGSQYRIQNSMILDEQSHLMKWLLHGNTSAVEWTWMVE